MRRVRIVLLVFAVAAPLCVWLGIRTPSPWLAFGLLFVPHGAAFFAVKIWAPLPPPQAWTEPKIRRHAWESVVLVPIGWIAFVGMVVAMVELTLNRTVLLASVAFLIPFVLVHAPFVFIRDRLTLRRRLREAGGPIGEYAEAFE